MKIKTGAVIVGNSIIDKMLDIGQRVYENHGKELVVTSGIDGTHGPGSMHPFAKALDFRTNFFAYREIGVVAKDLQNKLGPDYDVVVEKDHLHIEYDPK